MDYQITTLPGGAKVVAAPLKERNSVSIGLWVKAGGRDETPRLSGVSHFLEHVVFKGTRKRTANQIKQAVEGIGGSLNAFTSEEYTCFLAKCAGRHFEPVFDVLADMVLNASLKEEDIQKERAVIIEEIKMTQDQPAQLVDELLAEMVWPGHALGRPLAGTQRTVAGLSREAIHRYKETRYKPCSITVAAVGAIDEKTLVRAVEKKFASKQTGTGNERELFAHVQAKPRFGALEKKVEQTHLSLALRTFPKDHPDEYALDVLSVILGGNMSSRLFNEVREERGLAYEIGSSVRKYHETGAFGVEAGVDNHKALEALKVILAQLSRAATEKVPAGELERAKEFFLGQMDLVLESSMSHMLWIGENALCLGRCKSVEDVTRSVQKVSPADIRRVARGIFKTGGLNLAVVGPKVKELEPRFLKALSF